MQLAQASNDIKVDCSAAIQQSNNRRNQIVSNINQNYI